MKSTVHAARICTMNEVTTFCGRYIPTRAARRWTLTDRRITCSRCIASRKRRTPR